MGAPEPDNVIPFPSGPHRLPSADPTEYPGTFAKVLVMHLHEHTRQAKTWAPSRDRDFGVPAVVLMLCGLGAAVAAVFM